MPIVNLFTALTFIVWGVSLLGLVAVSGTILGLLALVTGILWIVSAFYPLDIPVRRA